MPSCYGAWRQIGLYFSFHEGTEVFRLPYQYGSVCSTPRHGVILTFQVIFYESNVVELSGVRGKRKVNATLHNTAAAPAEKS